MQKKIGGTITNWQTHTLTCTKEQIERVYPNQNLKSLVFTGTVVDDPTGRWLPGHHMRSSLITTIDREKGIIETKNTLYKVINEGGDIFTDIGDSVLEIFY